MSQPLKFGDVEWISWDEFSDMHSYRIGDALKLWRSSPEPRSPLDECEIGVRRENGAPEMIRFGDIPAEAPCEDCAGLGEEPCDDCGGAGIVECDRGAEHDCDSCDGLGKMDCETCS